MVLNLKRADEATMDHKSLETLERGDVSSNESYVMGVYSDERFENGELIEVSRAL